MKLTKEQLSQLRQAILSGNVQQIQELKDISAGKKVVLSTFYDCLKFFNTVDEKGNLIERESQMRSGEIEFEFIDPIKTVLERIIENQETNQ